jgi:hypothetical protein
MACNCEVAEFKRRLEFVPAEHRDYFDAMFLSLLDEREDHGVTKAVLDGSWPGSIDAIKVAARNLGYNLTPIDSSDTVDP